MHPIEWLRALARQDDLAPSELASEAATALAALSDDPLGMVPACRRLLDRHPEVGPLWWTCARMLAADDPRYEAQAVRDDLASDQVGLSLALDLPPDITVAALAWSPLVDELAGRRPDLVVDVVADATKPGAADMLLVEPWAVGDRELYAPAGIGAAEIETWLLVGVGRRLPEPLFRALRRRVEDRRSGVWPSGMPRPDGEALGLDRFARIVEPLVLGSPCPPELLSRH